jgi:N utilization substance protein B
MGSRSTSRRIAMQAIFQADASKTDINDALENLFKEENITDDVKDFSVKLATGVEQSKNDIDDKIKVFSKNWKIDRINLVNKAILRLALYEMMFLKDTPKAVIINEALELAKRYSDEDSAKYINGILGSAVV